MKVLNINCYVRLPDDFEGSEVDALHWLAEYHRTHRSEAVVHGLFHNCEHRDELWYEFWEIVNSSDKNVHGTLCCDEVQLNKWRNGKHG